MVLRLGDFENQQNESTNHNNINDRLITLELLKGLFELNTGHFESLSQWPVKCLKGMKNVAVDRG